VCVAANLERQYEFLKTQWVNQGTFFGSPDQRDPMVGPNEETTRSPSRNGDPPARPGHPRVRGELSFPSNRGGFSYAAAGWSAVIFWYAIGDINSAELCLRLAL
jgi:hypothetical protein